jgi:CRISPR-associated protein Cas6
MNSERVDVAFPLAGDSVPLDHGYALFGALCRVLGDLHGADWLAVHPVRGTAAGGTLRLKQHNLALRLRVAPAEITRILPLAGKSLDIDGSRVLVGTSRVFALEPRPALYARLVVIKGFMEPDTFLDAVRRQMSEREIKGEASISTRPSGEPWRRVLAVAGDTVVGFPVELRGLDDESSLRAQRLGIGGRQRFGCGVFVPARATAE